MATFAEAGVSVRPSSRPLPPAAQRPAAVPRAAVAFLTRLPVGGGALTAQQLSRAALWFPAVGLLVGGVMGGVRALAGTVLDPAPATALALVAAMLVTGALHEDGLADAADAIGAHVPRERRLEILRDSRVGTYGALALVFAVVFPLVVLTPLDDGDFLRAALVGHVVGRWSILPQSLLLPAARPDGAGALLRAGRRHDRRGQRVHGGRRARRRPPGRGRGRARRGRAAHRRGRAALPPHARRRDGRHLRGPDQGGRAGVLRRARRDVGLIERPP